MQNLRRKSRRINVGKVAIGDGAPISIQSMTNTDTRNSAATLKQIKELARLGCDIIRVAVPDQKAAETLSEITAGSPIPVIADIHFDYQLAITAIKNQVAAIRLNPGNLTDKKQIRLVAEKAQEYRIPIRVGANSGSLRPALISQMAAQGLDHDSAIAEALVESALQECALLEQYGMRDIKVALKSSSVPITIAAYKKFAERTDYPLHIGITESGTPKRGIIKSAVGIGALLLDGIGDTMRVSLTASPEEEVITGLRILEACGLRNAEPEIVSCPTCGRTQIDLLKIADQTESFLAEIANSGGKINLKKIAIMGCAVNGPGEARDADIGIAGSGAGKVIIFRHGKVIGAYNSTEGFERFCDEIRKFIVEE